MKLVLNSVQQGMYNQRELHAFLNILGDCNVSELDAGQYRDFINAKVLPILLKNFTSTSHTLGEFVYDDQGAPLSLLVTSNTKALNLESLFKSLRECIVKSSQELCDIKLSDGKSFFAHEPDNAQPLLDDYQSGAKLQM